MLLLQILQYNNQVLPTLWVMVLHSALGLLQQDGWKLLEHQQFQDPFFMWVSAQPLLADLAELAQSLSRFYDFSATQLPELFVQWLLQGLSYFLTA